MINLSRFESMKVFSVVALAVFMFLGLGTNNSFASCPYDILALCKVDGKWVNCCDHYGYTTNGVDNSDSSTTPKRIKSSRKSTKPVAKKAVLVKPKHQSSQSGYTSNPFPSHGGASIYQMNGLHGTVPMKLKSESHNGHEYTVMKLASKNLKEKTKWNAKLQCGENQSIKHFEISTANGPKAVFPTGNYTEDHINKNVMIKPWSLNTVEKQCKDALTKGNGDYKKEATIQLQPTTVDLVRFNASCVYNGTSNTKQYSGKVKPTTKVKCVLTNPPYKPET